MAPTESQILTTTLLLPSALQTILPQKTFIALFPASQRTHPQIATLYRALQLQRGLDLDAVRENIAAETRRGREQMRLLARSRARDARGNGVVMDDIELDVNAEGFSTSMGTKPVHNSKSLCEGIEEAVGEVESEVQVLEDEVQRLMEECESAVRQMEVLRMDDVPIDIVGLLAELEAIGQRAERRLGLEQDS